jgi:hypothetical protein
MNTHGDNGFFENIRSASQEQTSQKTEFLFFWNLTYVA